MQPSPDVPFVPVGTIKTFREIGPKYQVGGPLHRLQDADWMVQITLVESGETAEYRLTHLLDDPKAV